MNIILHLKNNIGVKNKMIIECYNKYTDIKFFWEYEDMQLKEAREENQGEHLRLLKRVSNKEIDEWYSKQTLEFKMKFRRLGDYYIVPNGVDNEKQIFFCLYVVLFHSIPFQVEKS